LFTIYSAHKWAVMCQRKWEPVSPLISGPINTWPTVIVFLGRNIGTKKKGAVNSKFRWMAEILSER
jgi:hypothetical protein